MFKTPITLSGFKKLQKELHQLIRYKRPEIISEISKARKHGDLKENAEYHAAREQQAFYERKIKNIELKLNSVQIIDIKNIPFNGKVIFGSTVSILNIDTNKFLEVRIVGDDEADFKNHLISINSPLARGLIGTMESDIVSIETPSGLVNYKVLCVKYI
ncbi:transcription elongation factor GreA [Buchnera aphidicola]|uniref:transcription elongation factor GreA n=1 Tax=Buchnera aphidicola TaxID=9 RepID=UPI0034645ADE